MTQSKEPLLRVQNLYVRFQTSNGEFAAVKNVSLSVGQERVAIVGESGSGKSQTARAILGLTPENGRVDARELSFNGVNLAGLSEKEWGAVRGRRISMIMQDPKFSLNPVMRIGDQIVEALKVSRPVPTPEARRRTVEMLRSVKINDPERVFNLYPHEVSGGMGQRVMIAMMLITEPELLIADEPTSALDVSVQEQVISLLNDLVVNRGVGLLIITHDLRMVSRFCDRVIVMYKGSIVEELESSDLRNAKHPYTQHLLNCVPGLTHRVKPLPSKGTTEDWGIV